MNSYATTGVITKINGASPGAPEEITYDLTLNTPNGLVPYTNILPPHRPWVSPLFIFALPVGKKVKAIVFETAKGPEVFWFFPTEQPKTTPCPGS